MRLDRFPTVQLLILAIIPLKLTLPGTGMSLEMLGISPRPTLSTLYLDLVPMVGKATGASSVDGPFADYVNAIGPGYLITDHCIDHNISDAASEDSPPSGVEKCHGYDNWDDAWACMESIPHQGGHGGVGLQVSYSLLATLLMQLSDLFQDGYPNSPPGDPIFYLHHTWLDKVWWDWQAMDLPGRLEEMGGTNLQTFDNTFPDVPGINGTVPFEGTCNGVLPYLGDSGNTTTLSHIF